MNALARMFRTDSCDGIEVTQLKKDIAFCRKQLNLLGNPGGNLYKRAQVNAFAGVLDVRQRQLAIAQGRSFLL